MPQVKPSSRALRPLGKVTHDPGTTIAPPAAALKAPPPSGGVLRIALGQALAFTFSAPPLAAPSTRQRRVPDQARDFGRLETGLDHRLQRPTSRLNVAGEQSVESEGQRE